MDSSAARAIWLWGALIAVLTALGVFLLPLLFPPVHPAFSASYSAGFNNRVATVAAALMCLATFALAWRVNGIAIPRPSQFAGRISQRSLTLALAACAVFTLGLGGILTRAAVAYNDNLYFLEYMDEVTRYHLRLYKDFNFLYGPVMIYFPVAIEHLLQPFHAGLQTSYYIALTLMQLLGLVLLWAILEALPLPGKAKTLTLYLFTLAVLCPLLGINYTLVRSLLPFGVLLLATRIEKPLQVAAIFFCGEILQLSISPEMGVSFAAGACFYALCRCLCRRPAYLPALLAPPLAAVAFLAVTGKVYLNSISQFSSGCLNLIVEPLPYILFFLFAFIWLIPRMLGSMTRTGDAQALPMCSLFVLCLACLPPALGRCDPLHVLFNGAGGYVLAVVAICAYSDRVRETWFFGLFLVIVFTQLVNLSVFLGPILYATKIDLFEQGAATERSFPDFQGVLRLEKLAGDARISTPFIVPYVVEEELKRSGAYQPDPLVFHIGLWDAASETARMARMDAMEWALIPRHVETLAETARSSELILGFGFPYPQRREPYHCGALLLDDLEEHWTVAAESSAWTLYRNNRPATSRPASAPAR